MAAQLQDVKLNSEVALDRVDPMSACLHFRIAHCWSGITEKLHALRVGVEQLRESENWETRSSTRNINDDVFGG